MQEMIYALKERIGAPSLFSGRKQEMELLLDWAEKIPKEISKSRALLARRKSGKTAIMQRIFNILWNRKGTVIPFYIEISDQDQWLLDFASNYYLTFLTQYLSFLTRTVLPKDQGFWEIEELEQVAGKIGHKNILKEIHYFKQHRDAERIEDVRRYAFGAPARFAGSENIFFLVMIDEIQFMTKHIFYDKDRKIQAYNLPGAYHGLVESKIAPMLVSGSYIGWLSQMISDMFKGGRLTVTEISPKLTFGEGMGAVYQYAEHHNVPLTGEAALALNILTQGDPYYIATLFRSDYPGKDFTRPDGAVKTLAYEITNRKGELYRTWSEYIDSTIKDVNDKYAKQVLLFLSKERHKECTRKEIYLHLQGKLEDAELEKKLRMLEYGDLIKRGSSDFRYCGIPDDILDLIFRARYQEEIYQVKPDIDSQLTAKITELEDEKKSLQGALNELKGRMLEFIVYRELAKSKKEGKPVLDFRKRVRPIKNQKYAQSIEKLLSAVSENAFHRVWMNFYLQLPGTGLSEIDVLAEGAEGEYYWALLFEIKNRDEKYPASLHDAKSFTAKVDMLKLQANQQGKKIRFICPVFLCAKEFEKDVEDWLHRHGVLTADMESWDN